jgi:restriction endonuclease S subunit
MGVSAGYKQTECGIVPEEWQVKRIDQVAEANWGNTAITKDSYCTAGYAAYSASGLDGFVSWFDHDKPAVILSAIGAQCGKSWFATDKWTAIKNTIWIRGDDRAATSEFIYRITGNPSFWPNRGQAQPFIALGDVRAAKIPVPPLPEQRAIATALSDVDALLDGLDRLIAKKRDLKQATMQQLLTGQTRLPGFSGEWEVKFVGAIFEISTGRSKSVFVAEGGDYVICDMGSVSIEGRLIASKRTNYRADFLSQGDLVMPKDDIGGGKIVGRVGYVDASGTYVLGDHVYRLRAREGNSLFLCYLINSHSINSALRRKVIGSAQLGLGRRSVEEQELRVPPLNEQIAIAAVLSDMDAELAALEARRDKTRDLKKAMMQELLTGRTRLV